MRPNGIRAGPKFNGWCLRAQRLRHTRKKGVQLKRCSHEPKARRIAGKEARKVFLGSL